MKVAVGLFGIHFSNALNHWTGVHRSDNKQIRVDYKHSYENNKSILFDSIDAHFYSATYFSPVLENLISDYNFKVLKIKKLYNGVPILTFRNITDYNPFILRNYIFVDTLELIMNDIKKIDYENTPLYDYVLLTRYDMNFLQNPLNFVDYEKLNVVCYIKWGDSSDYIDDNFYFMPTSIFEKFYNEVKSLDIRMSSHEYHKYISADINFMVTGSYHGGTSSIYNLPRLQPLDK